MNNVNFSQLQPCPISIVSLYKAKRLIMPHLIYQPDNYDNVSTLSHYVCFLNHEMPPPICNSLFLSGYFLKIVGIGQDLTLERVYLIWQVHWRAVFFVKNRGGGNSVQIIVSFCFLTYTDRAKNSGLYASLRVLIFI